MPSQGSCAFALSGNVPGTIGTYCCPLVETAGYVEAMWAGIGSMVIGRHLFDITNGWEGAPPAGDHVVIVSHRPKPDDWHPEGFHPVHPRQRQASYYFISKRYFGSIDAQHLLEDAHAVIQGNRVLRLRYRACR